MGKILGLEERIRNYNDYLESKGSSVYAIEYDKLYAEAKFKCRKCGQTFEALAASVKTNSRCRVCEMEKKPLEKAKKVLEASQQWSITGYNRYKCCVKCNDCGAEREFSFSDIKYNKHICQCQGNKGYTDTQVNKTAKTILKYMLKDCEGYGLLEGEELNSYVKDMIRIGGCKIKDTEGFCEAVLDSLYNLMNESGISRCKRCKRLFPPKNLYRGICRKRCSR